MFNLRTKPSTWKRLRKYWSTNMIPIFRKRSVRSSSFPESVRKWDTFVCILLGKLSPELVYCFQNYKPNVSIKIIVFVYSRSWYSCPPHYESPKVDTKAHRWSRENSHWTWAMASIGSVARNQSVAGRIRSDHLHANSSQMPAMCECRYLSVKRLQAIIR